MIKSTSFYQQVNSCTGVKIHFVYIKIVFRAISLRTAIWYNKKKPQSINTFWISLHNFTLKLECFLTWIWFFFLASTKLKERSMAVCKTRTSNKCAELFDFDLIWLCNKIIQTIEISKVVVCALYMSWKIRNRDCTIWSIFTNCTSLKLFTKHIF